MRPEEDVRAQARPREQQAIKLYKSRQGACTVNPVGSVPIRVLLLEVMFQGRKLSVKLKQFPIILVARLIGVGTFRNNVTNFWEIFQPPPTYVSLFFTKPKAHPLYS